MDNVSWQYPDTVSTSQAVSRLQAVRSARGLSREKVGARIGYSAKQIERWEKGVTPVKPMHLMALAEVYGVDVTDLEEAA